MSYEDDDVDFSGPTTGLAAVPFGATRPASASISSAAQQQPQASQASAANQAAAALLAQAKPMVAMAVDAFKFVGDQYQSQGRVGLSLLGVAASRQYILIMYKQGPRGEKLPLTLTMVGEKFKFIVRADNYGSFYDDNSCNWAARFDTADSLASFCLEVTIARTLSNTKQQVVLQDVILSGDQNNTETVADGWKVECNYTPYSLASDGLSPPVKGQTALKQKLKASANKQGLNQFFVGMGASGGRRIAAQLQQDGSYLLYDITVLRAKGPSAAPSVGVSDLESSQTSGRGGILSRMARLGHQVMPGPEVNVQVDADQQDSDAESVSVPTATPTKQPRARDQQQAQPQQTYVPARPLPAAVAAAPGVTMVMGQTGVPIPTLMPQTALATKQQIAVYQSPVYAAQQPQLIQQADMTSPQPSMDTQRPEWSVLFMETRQNSTEMRLVLSKLQDRLDSIHQKIEQQHQQQAQYAANTDVAGGILDGKAVMSALQRMVAEEERLREELKTRQSKIEDLNLKVSELLVDKQKMIEQSNKVLSDRSDALSTSAAQSAGRVLQLEEEKANMALRVSTLTAEVGDLHLMVAEKRRTELELRNEMIAMKETVAAANKIAEDATAAMKDMESKMAAVKDSESLATGELTTEKRRVAVLQSELADVKKQLEAAQIAISSKDSSLTDVLLKNSEEQSASAAKIRALEEEISRLKTDVQNSRSNTDRLSDQLRSKMAENQELSQDRDRINAELQEKLSAAQEALSQVSELRRQLDTVKHEQSSSSSEIDSIRASYETRIADLEARLSQQTERYNQLAASSPSSADIEAMIAAQVKSIMNQVYQSSRAAINNEDVYEGVEVLKTLLAVIKQTTLSFLGGNSAAGPVTVAPAKPTERQQVVVVQQPEPTPQASKIEEQSVHKAEDDEAAPETNHEAPEPEVSHHEEHAETEKDTSELNGDDKNDEKDDAKLEDAKGQLNSQEVSDAQEDLPDYSQSITPVYITEDGATEENEIVPVHRDHPVPEDSAGKPPSDDEAENDEEKAENSAEVESADPLGVVATEDAQPPEFDPLQTLETPEPSPSQPPEPTEEPEEEVAHEESEKFETVESVEPEPLAIAEEAPSETEVDDQPPIHQIEEMETTVETEEPIPRKQSLFGESDDSDMEDLFAKPPPAPVVESKLPSKDSENNLSLFDQSKEEEHENSEDESAAKRQPPPPPVPATKGGALFGDDDEDDDDWFGGK